MCEQAAVRIEEEACLTERLGGRFETRRDSSRETALVPRICYLGANLTTLVLI